MVINTAGTYVIIYIFRSFIRYTVKVHRVMAVRHWLNHPRYCHSTPKPSGLATCHISSENVSRNSGMVI